MGDVEALRGRGEGFLWLDLPEPTSEELALIQDVFVLDPAEIKDCVTRSLVPRVIPHDPYIFFILHTIDDEGHLLEMDSFRGVDYLITTHGPLTPGVPLELALRETSAVMAKLDSGEFRPTDVDQIAHAVISGFESTLEELLLRVAGRVGTLDRAARENDIDDTEEFLEELFGVRHSLLTLRNRAAQSRQACHTLAFFEESKSGKLLFEDLEQRFDRLTALCDGERDFTQGVLDFIESITSTRTSAAMNRLALISFVVLPASALIGFFGISSISYSETSLRDTFIFAFFLLVLTLATLRWTKSKGWW